jgi:hypothetical protein
MSFRLATPPRSIEAAYRTLTDPAAHNCHPAIIQTNWKFLKEARGEKFYPERLSIIAHVIETQAFLRAELPDGSAVSIPVQVEQTLPAPDFRYAAPPQAQAVNTIDAARLRAMPAIQRAIHALWGDHEPTGAA